MRKLWKYLIILVATVLLWNRGILRSVRILSLLFHKTGHAVTAFFCGCGIQSFGVTFSKISDLTINTKGRFASFAIASGGYMGNLAFFALIMFLKDIKVRKYIIGCLSMVYLAITIFNPAFQGATTYSAIFASVALALYMIQNKAAEEFILDVIGISSVTYIIYDTLVSTILLKINQRFLIISGWGQKIPPDIITLDNLTFLPQVLWAIIWLALSTLVLNLVVFRGKK
ncbi:MAG: M50 family peptidase [Clostridium sp.]|nr:M50 family peptidase [Clostridium sp.]